MFAAKFAQAEKLFTADVDLRINTYLEIELAAPPAKLCEEAVQTVRTDQVRDFLREISFFLFDLEEAGKPVPKLFVKCDKYETPYEREEEPGEYCAKEHWDCINCIGSFKLVGMSDGEFYDKYYQKWKDAHPSKTHYTSKYVNKNPIPRYSQAPVAADVTNLWMATLDQNGANLVQLEPNGIYVTPQLFYYKIVREMDAGPIKNIVDTLQTAKKQRYIERSLALKQEHEREKQQEIELTLTFFG